LPLIAHNGASFDGPIISGVCERLGLPLPSTFLVLDTLPLARTLFPLEKEHRVGALAKRFDCDRTDAHRADADVEMLAGIVQGLEREMQSSVTGAAVYELLRRAGDPWAAVLKPPVEVPRLMRSLLPLARTLSSFFQNVKDLHSYVGKRATIKAHPATPHHSRPYGQGMFPERMESHGKYRGQCRWAQMLWMRFLRRQRHGDV